MIDKNMAAPVEHLRTIQAINPATDTLIVEQFPVATFDDVDRIVRNANEAFLMYKKKTYQQRGAWLRTIAKEILELGQELIDKCVEETALPETRIIGERARTVNQLIHFAQLVEDGAWINARIDTELPDRTPIPRPDIRQSLQPLGPVAVFEASNFPLAFSTAGGDTASALAAGCTVVAKSHSSHPGTSSLIAKAIKKAAQDCEMPEGVFTLIHGPGGEVGIQLASHPLIKAVGFTGSFDGGMALWKAANQRSHPIPVFAEMGSINPVFILPDVIKRDENVAAKIVDSIVLGTGQFCTNPGLLIIQRSPESPSFIKTLSNEMAKRGGASMLSPKIKKSYEEGVKNFQNISGVRQLAQGITTTSENQGIPFLFEVSGELFQKEKRLSAEVFGPSSLCVIVENAEQMLSLATGLEGSLTATIFGTANDLKNYSTLIDSLQEKAGRILLNNVPTGVEVCHGMVHGGPFPATTDGRSTSVGTLAIYRFTRPICYQNFVDAYLPPELQNRNPLGIPRWVDGILTRDSL